MIGRVSDTTMTQRSSGFELELAAETDNVPLVRHALRGLLEASGVTEERIADITLAVTEACAIADVLEIDTPGGSGTLVRMTFDVSALAS